MSTWCNFNLLVFSHGVPKFKKRSTEISSFLLHPLKHHLSNIKPYSWKQQVLVCHFQVKYLRQSGFSVQEGELSHLPKVVLYHVRLWIEQFSGSQSKNGGHGSKKNFNCYSVVETALTMIRFCETSESYSWIWSFWGIL